MRACDSTQQRTDNALWSCCAATCAPLKISTVEMGMAPSHAKIALRVIPCTVFGSTCRVAVLLCKLIVLRQIVIVCLLQGMLGECGMCWRMMLVEQWCVGTALLPLGCMLTTVRSPSNPPGSKDRVAVVANAHSTAAMCGHIVDWPSKHARVL